MASAGTRPTDFARAARTGLVTDKTTAPRASTLGVFWNQAHRRLAHGL